MRILLVDDHADSLNVLGYLLKHHQHDVTSAATLADALRRCETSTFDLLICDIRLPDGDAWGLAKVARANGYPAIALTGCGLPTDVAKSASSGFAEHLLKPILFEELLAAISRAVPAPAHAIPAAANFSGSADSGNPFSFNG